MKIGWLILGCLMALSLVLASCTAAVTEEEEAPPEEEEVVTEEEEEEAPPEEEVVLEEKGPQYGGTITLHRTSFSGDFDPFRFHNDALKSFVMDQLGMGDWSVDREKWSFKYDYCPVQYSKGQLAESWEMPDDQTYIFHIRKGVYFHDKPPANGREMTADDIAFCFHRILGLGSGYTEPSPYISMSTWKYIESVTATDKYTLVFKTSEPRGLLLEYFLTAGLDDQVYPPELVNEYGEDWRLDWRNVVGTGPFTLEDFVLDSSVTFKKNTNYWDRDEFYPKNKLPYVDSVKYLIIPDMSTELAALRTGKIDIMRGLSWEQADSLQGTNPELQSVSYGYNCQALSIRNDLEPFSDLRVRRALQMGLDLERIAETYYGGHADPFPCIMPAHFPSVYTPLDEYPEEVQEAFTYNPERAKQLLAEAGYPNGFQTTVLMSSSAPVGLAELVKAYWEEIGVDLVLDVKEGGGLGGMIYGREFEIFWFWAHMNGTPSQSLNYYYPKVPWNFSEVNDPVFSEMVDKIRISMDPAELDRLMKEAGEYGTEQHFFIGLPAPTLYRFWQPWLKGYRGEFFLGQYVQGPLYARIWIDQDLKYELTGKGPTR